MSLVQKKQLLLVNVNGTKVRQEASSLVHKQELAINVVTMKSISYLYCQWLYDWHICQWLVLMLLVPNKEPYGPSYAFGANAEVTGKNKMHVLTPQEDNSIHGLKLRQLSTKQAKSSKFTGGKGSSLYMVNKTRRDLC